MFFHHTQFSLVSFSLSQIFSFAFPCLHLSPGSCLGKQWGVSAPQPPAYPELGSTELTVLSLIRDRRDSSGSATSSAYLSSSRRSSGISPCFSSRRSSQASQSEGTSLSANHRRIHNLSSTDSYDPISTDASRRSSEASQYGGGVAGGGIGIFSGGSCGGLGFGTGGGSGSRGMLNLTPAQHYHLKAKYAAATGGPPPTPLPNMERMSLKTRMVMMEEGGNNCCLPPLVRPPHYSESNSGYNNGGMGHVGYRRRILYPGEGPVSGIRRASDPVRTQAPETFSLPPVQRFNSLNNLHPLPPLTHHSTPESRNFSLQNYTRMECNIQNSSNTSSIAENVALEALAMENEDEASLFLEDEDMLPDDLVQYLHSQVQINTDSYVQTEDQLAINQRDTSRSGVLEAIQTSESDGTFLGSHSLQQQQISERNSPSRLPIQWNEVSSGSADRSPQKEQNHHSQYGRWLNVEHEPTSIPFGKLRNMVVHQQLSPDVLNNCFQANQPQSVNPGVKLETSPNSCMEMRGTGHNSTNIIGRSNFVHMSKRPLPQSLKQHMCSINSGTLKLGYFQQNNNGSTSCQVGNNLALSRGFMDSLPQEPPYHDRLIHVPHPPINGSKDLVKTQQHFNSESSNEIHARPCQPQQLQRSGDQCSLAYQVSGLKLENPDHGYIEQVFADCLAYEPADCKASSFPILEDQSFLDSIAVSEEPGGDNENTSALPSPGTNQVTSTVNGHVPGILDEGVNLDFGNMLEDSYDQGSLVSGVLSPSIFQGMSRTSSRLTTPRAAVTFHSVAPGLSNMAIGDMSSLLTTLAEESKFLAVMQ